MENKVKHPTPYQSVPNKEFLPLLRGEAPYFGNLNRPSQSAYNLANSVAEIQAWGGTVSVLRPVNPNYEFKLYQIARITDNEDLIEATITDDPNSRYGIVVAEAEFDTVAKSLKNVVVCTFCPNFIYPSAYAPSEAAGLPLYLNTVTGLSNTGNSTCSRVLAKKTGTNSIFFSGTATLW